MKEPIEYVEAKRAIAVNAPPRGEIVAREAPPDVSAVALTPSHQGVGLLQTVGITPAVAIITILLDFMLSALDWMTLGGFLFFSAVAAAGLSYFTYHAQRKTGDDHQMAMAKAVILAVITLIPVPISGFIAAPAGIAGFLSKRPK